VKLIVKYGRKCSWHISHAWVINRDPC